MAVEMPDLVTTHEIASRIGVPASLVRTWVARGKLPAPAMRVPARIGRPMWEWSDIRETMADLLHGYESQLEKLTARRVAPRDSR